MISRESSVANRPSISCTRLVKQAAFATPELIALIECERNQTGWNFSERLRATAIKTLGQVGPAARDATPTLIKMLKHRDLSVRSATARALPPGS